MPAAADLNTMIASSLKKAMRKMPSPVAIVSAADRETSQPCGLAVTAYGPVSMDPPSMQICVNRSAGAYNAILATGVFAINILGLDGELALECFVDPARKQERFSGEHWQVRAGVPHLTQANFSIFCRIAETHNFGTHTVIIALVEDILQRDGVTPAVWLESKLCSVEAQ